MLGMRPNEIGEITGVSQGEHGNQKSGKEQDDNLEEVRPRSRSKAAVDRVNARCDRKEKNIPDHR